ncbi:MAG: hypothetical protein EBU57_12705 [Alphaproteobacteria bacterium]|nr:hypothetical protein [Alphaproteobacteria bacterium]
MITEIVSFDRHPGMDRDEMVADAAWLERAEAHWGNRPTLERYDCFLILENPGGKITECAEG